MPDKKVSTETVIISVILKIPINLPINRRRCTVLISGKPDYGYALFSFVCDHIVIKPNMSLK